MQRSILKSLENFFQTSFYHINSKAAHPTLVSPRGWFFNLQELHITLYKVQVILGTNKYPR